MGLSFSHVQKLGRALMLPIAVLPVAGILLRLGQPDLLDIAFITQAGEAIFSHLGLLFAIGVAIGFAKEQHGAAGLAGVVAFLVATSGAKVLIDAPPDIVNGLTGDALDVAIAAYQSQAIAKLGVPLGIICGIAGGLLFNRYGEIKLPEFLSFFGGRRFVPIICGGVGVILAYIFGSGWGAIEASMDSASLAIATAGEAGLFVFGVLNRLLIVTGLHHILNNAAWFIVGDYEGVTGDLRRFFAGDPEAGAFMSGFFPVMMFGMPAACLAMYRAALPAQKPQVAGLYTSMALTSFLTGITEPIEFTFMFLAPVLYAVHAVLTGFSMVVMDVLDVRLGFGFSAGLLDYILNFELAKRPLMLLPVGMVYFAVYYLAFSVTIRRFNLLTPGRDKHADKITVQAASSNGQGEDFALALGGGDNIQEIGACTTRLRLVINAQDAVDEAALRRLGAKGIVKPTATTIQIILGPTAELVATDIKRHLSMSPHAPNAEAPTPALKAITPEENAPTSQTAVHTDTILQAVGGRDNITGTEAGGKRLVLKLKKIQSEYISSIASLPDIRTAIQIGDHAVHILFKDGDPTSFRM